MKTKPIWLAVLLLAVSAAALFYLASPARRDSSGRPQFVQRRGIRFELNGKPFRFVGANVSVMYRDEDRARMPETLRHAAQAGIKVVRI